VLNLPLPDGLKEEVGTVSDVDEVIRLAHRDLHAAADLVRDSMTAVDARASDWPDLLAAELHAAPDFLLSTWADNIGVAPCALSRGFAAAYGVTPKRYRLEQRVRRALLALPNWPGTLAALAAEVGFADQAHFARASVALTGHSPSTLRR
jgi:AraC-like DNA-binding protein